MSDIPKPSKTFTIRVNGEKREVLMTYGLHTEIMKVIPSPQQVGDLIISDPYLRDYIVRRMLTGSKRVESDDDLVDPFENDIDIDELDALVNWVAEHVFHFFMKSAARTAETAKKYEAVVTRLSQSQTGSES